MAEMATVRRVTLDDGTTAELDGDALSIRHGASGAAETSAAPVNVLTLTESDKDGLIWLLRGTSPRKDRGAPKGARKAKGALDAKPADVDAEAVAKA